MSAVFYPVPLISLLVFLISDVVNELPTRHIIIETYFHLLCIFTCTYLFPQVIRAIPGVSIVLNVLFIFNMKKSNIKYCQVFRNINKEKLYFVL